MKPHPITGARDFCTQPLTSHTHNTLHSLPVHNAIEAESMSLATWKSTINISV
uniref:Uncharacterized protein n=1 Tax=Anguilla anguilla TaxID=7936 RepID=A0A0E9X2E5_ANGAN